MAKDKGILITQDLDLLLEVERDNSGIIVSGIRTGNTLYQNQYLILQAQKGEFKESPVLGVGIGDITNDDEITSWQRDIREQLQLDGMRVEKLNINETSMELKAQY